MISEPSWSQSHLAGEELRESIPLNFPRVFISSMLLLFNKTIMCSLYWVLSLLYAHPLSYVLCHRTQPENLQHTQYLTVCAQHLYLEPFLLLSQDFSFLHLHVVRAKVLDNYSKKTIFVVSKSYNFDLSNWFTLQLLLSRRKYFRDNQENISKRWDGYQWE